jgi:hypothetical protein
MAAALSPVVVEASDGVHRMDVVKSSYGDRTQGSNFGLHSEVIHRLSVRVGGEAQTEPVNNFGKAIRG